MKNLCYQIQNKSSQWVSDKFTSKFLQKKMSLENAGKHSGHALSYEFSCFFLNVSLVKCETCHKDTMYYFFCYLRVSEGAYGINGPFYFLWKYSRSEYMVSHVVEWNNFYLDKWEKLLDWIYVFHTQSLGAICQFFWAFKEGFEHNTNLTATQIWTIHLAKSLYYVA